MIKLYSAWRSSAAYRVRIALALKDVPYEYLPVNLVKEENRGADYLALNPQGLVPALETGTVVAHRVGLRPARSRVRLEAEDGVVHCYGHGGAGVTLSWGTADEVASLVAG